MASFETVWSYFKVNLKPGTGIKNWTAYSGYLGDNMAIKKVRDR